MKNTKSKIFDITCVPYIFIFKNNSEILKKITLAILLSIACSSVILAIVISVASN